MRVRCEKCKREIVTVETNFDAKYAIKTGKTYLKSETVAKWTTRQYCAFCGKWVK